MKLARLFRHGLVLLVPAAALAGALAVGDGRPAHAGPTPDCGPTRQWNCVVPGCPDCPEILFEGTVCEKNAFEKATGRVCSPA